jgi:phospholipid/cholesterol/gamma-HCH transport system permease protein
VISKTAKSFAGFLTELGKITNFVIRMIHTLFTMIPSLPLVVQQMYDIGIKTLPVLFAVCLFVGSNVAVVGYHIFKQFGGQDLIGAFVGLTFIREMAPILVGAIMAAKPGTDISATVATMRVKEQIDALEVMSVDPVWFLVVPRMIAFVIMAPFLVIFADFVCTLSSYFTAVFQMGVNSGKFVEEFVKYLSVMDFFKGMVKGVVSSFLVCILSCYFGYHSAPGPKGVSRAINISVVLEASLIVVVNYFLTEMMYGVK